MDQGQKYSCSSCVPHVLQVSPALLTCSQYPMQCRLKRVINSQHVSLDWERSKVQINWKTEIQLKQRECFSKKQGKSIPLAHEKEDWVLFLNPA